MDIRTKFTIGFVGVVSGTGAGVGSWIGSHVPMDGAGLLGALLGAALAVFGAGLATVAANEAADADAASRRRHMASPP